MADGSYVGDEEQRIFDSFSLFASLVQLDDYRKNELSQIAEILSNRVNNATSNLAKTTIRRLVEAIVGIIAETMHDINLQQVRHNRRHIEIVSKFRHLLAEHIATHHQPSYYASLLNVSPVYLNEVIKDVTSMNTTLYIKKEVVLHAKRLLTHTDLTGKDIAIRLGFDDYAYFSRLFSQATRTSPTVVRERKLD